MTKRQHHRRYTRQYKDATWRQYDADFKSACDLIQYAEEATREDRAWQEYKQDLERYYYALLYYSTLLSEYFVNLSWWDDVRGDYRPDVTYWQKGAHIDTLPVEHNAPLVPNLSNRRPEKPIPPLRPEPPPELEEPEVNWTQRAEAYCRDELGITHIAHADNRYRYNISGFPLEEKVAMFDADGFLVTTLSLLRQHWGLGYFPDGIKGYNDYVTKEEFEEIDRLRANIAQAVAQSGQPISTEAPPRFAADDPITFLLHAWRRQDKKCLICGTHVSVEESNPMMQIARGMIDATKATYDHDNTLIGHYACILAKNKWGMNMVTDWIERTRAAQ